MKTFHDADTAWLHCMAAHRKKNSFVEIEKEMAQYDVIAGKLRTMQQTERWLHTFPELLERWEAGTLMIFVLAGCCRYSGSDRLKDQYCFKTVKAIDCLHFVEGEKIWLKK